MIDNSNIPSTEKTNISSPVGRVNHIQDYLILEDAEIYYEVYGSGPPLIFAHGLGGNHLSWWKQIPYFIDRFTCVTFSHRGFSLSKNLSGKIGAKAFADDLSALINHLGLKDINLVAQSMGGWTSLNYALRENSSIRSLVLASTTGELNYSVIDHPQIKKLDEWKSISEKITSELKSKGLLAATGPRMALEQPEMNFLYKQIYDLTPTPYKDKVRKDIRSSRTLAPNALTNLKIPVLFIVGDEDIVFPPAAAEAASSLISNSKMNRVPKAGHSVYFERPEIFNKLVDDFLASLTV